MANKAKSWAQWAMGVLEGSGQKAVGKVVINKRSGVVSWTVETDEGALLDMTAQVRKVNKTKKTSKSRKSHK